MGTNAVNVNTANVTGKGEASSVKRKDIEESLDIMTIAKEEGAGSFTEYMFNPLQIGFAALGARSALKNNTGLYMSRCADFESRRGLTKLLEIDNGYLGKMCNSKDAMISARAQFLRTRIDMYKRVGFDKHMAESCLQEFEELSKNFYKNKPIRGFMPRKAPGIARAWKSQGGKAMFAFSLLLEGIMTVPAAFKAKVDSEGNEVKGPNYKAGFKQIGEVAGKAALTTGGWVAGAAIGASIGSIIPGAGTAIGGVIGALAGFIGGNLGMYATEKICDATGLSNPEGTRLANIKQKQANKKDAYAITQGDAGTKQHFAENLNNWLVANALTEDGKLKEDMSDETKKDYEQLIKTAREIGLA